MLLAGQYSCRNGIEPLCTGPVFPFASLFFQSYDIALTGEIFITNNTIHCFVRRINCWKSPSVIIGKLKLVNCQGELL